MQTVIPLATPSQSARSIAQQARRARERQQKQNAQQTHIEHGSPSCIEASASARSLGQRRRRERERQQAREEIMGSRVGHVQMVTPPSTQDGGQAGGTQ